jgi:hypothetical protein
MRGRYDGVDMIRHDHISMNPQALVLLTIRERFNDAIEEGGRSEHILPANDCVRAEIK